MFTRIAIFIVTIYRINSLDVAYAKAKSDRIIYPGPTLDNRSGDDDDAPLIIPESCRNLTYCFEKPVNYPQEKYDKMFEGKNLAPLPTIVQSTIGDRLNDDGFEDDCEAEVMDGPLYSVRASKGEWLKVLQAPTKHYQQYVRMEVCESRGTPCFKDLPSFGGLISTCRQTQAKYEIVVEDGKGKTFKVDVELPSCCVCRSKSPVLD